MAYDERVLKYAPWSISKANLMGLCLRQGGFKYVDKFKEGKKSTQSRVGTVAHAVLEAARKVTFDVETLTEEARRICVRDELSHDETVEILSKVPGILDYVRRVNAFKAEHGVARELIEYQLAMDENGNGVPFFDKRAFFRGVIDDGLWTSDDVLVMIDHKSGRKKPIREHSTQFYAYMGLAVANFPALRGVQPAINYFGEPKLDWFPRFDGSGGPWSREEIVQHVFPWLETYLNKLSKRLLVLDTGSPNPETGWQCEYCGYVDRCPEGTTHAAARKAKRGDLSTNL